MKGEAGPSRILTIDPTSRGFGYAVLEGAGRLIAWGVRAGGQTDVVLRKLHELIGLYRPEVLVVEDCATPKARRRARVRNLLDTIVHNADAVGLRTHRISVAEVRHLFAANNAATKHAIALAVAEHFPELAPRLPPKRKIYMSEAERMAIFDATAFGLTHYFLAAERDAET